VRPRWPAREYRNAGESSIVGGTRAMGALCCHRLFAQMVENASKCMFPECNEPPAKTRLPPVTGHWGESSLNYVQPCASRTCFFCATESATRPLPNRDVIPCGPCGRSRFQHVKPLRWPRRLRRPWGGTAVAIGLWTVVIPTRSV